MTTAEAGTLARLETESRDRLRQAVRSGKPENVRAASAAYTELVVAVEQAMEDDRQEWASRLRNWFASPHAEAHQ